ncbi:acyl CoA--acetate/3-ketoacid CoA transferase subunit alpha [Kibdelosporangium philippinense]|uniref:Acyl CoA--acetate/3-ketoacid CoA transferase subunit alpha n=1 Tax=Kibdelosporangium philippinense TaxID=211113 RepID=A0ABS8Z055_9PSEU|nr:CoA-transferase [Kibdelosporangium philippinense]MCE7001364.1 acyl CoA--acetate/3-ketoacid CoA transferase subunit alpha [Kibdelosporangium philippinense]
MRDKRMTPAEVVAELSDGMTVGIGGWGSRRKPMALVRAILDSPLKNLTIVSYGGPDVGLLAAAGKIRKLVFGFVSLDTVAYDPYFQKLRQEGDLDVTELDEGMFQCGLLAAGHRLPFLPIRAGLGSDVMRTNPELRTIRSPYDGEELVAMPALHLDVALIHMNRADRHGNAQYLGPDPYFDDLFCLAAKRRYVSCEQVVDTFEGPVQTLLLNRMMVDGVVETPNGAHFTSCVPDYPRDEQFQKLYAEANWDSFVDRFLTGGERGYQEAVRAWR